MLNVLCTKGRLARFRAARRYIYRPKISWESAANEAVSNLIKQFDLDSLDDIILAMARKRLITIAQLRNIADQLSRA
jgi:predicted transcriptional regulator